MVSPLSSPLPPPHSPNYPPVPIPSSFHCYTICSKSSPEGGPHHHLLCPSPGGCGDKLSSPPTPTSLSCSRHPSRFHANSTFLFCLPLILLSLMWGLSFSSSLVSQGELWVSPCLSYPHAVFRPVLSFPPPCIALLIKERVFFGVVRILRLWDFAYVCVCVCRRLNTLNKCALMRLEISPQRKRVRTQAHTFNSTAS